ASGGSGGSGGADGALGPRTPGPAPASAKRAAARSRADGAAEGGAADDAGHAADRGFMTPTLGIPRRSRRVGSISVDNGPVVDNYVTHKSPGPRPSSPSPRRYHGPQQPRSRMRADYRAHLA